LTGSIIQAAPTGADDLRVHPWQRVRKSFSPAAAWAAGVFLMYQLIVAVDYPLHDADSILYESIAASLENRPLAEWLAPMWPPGSAKSGSFVEHPPFFFWPAAALGRLGLARGALLANLLYFLGCLYLLFRIARPLARAECAWLAVALYVFSPLGIQYLVRANQENAWAIGFLGALYCMRNPQRRAALGVGFVLFAAFAFAVKGVLALSLFPVLGLWWWVTSRRREELLWFAVAACAVAAIALWYEGAYRRLTGESFFARYVEAQLTYVYRDERVGWLHKLINPVYYAANIVWFAFPSSLLAVIAVYRTRRARKAPTQAQEVAFVGVGAYFALALPISRRAARYIFPAYPLIHVPAAELICDRAPKLAAWLRLKEAYLPYALMLILVVVLAGRVAADLHLYRFVQVF
jgi:4-amino-4-deoxy-L-arabinose transferase-like glycosyltransferase